MLMPRTLGAAIAAAFAAIALQPGLSLAQDKPVALKISHWVPASHPMHKPTEEWAASMNKASGGTLTFSIFPAQQLGKAFDHYDMARDGIADFTMINPGYQPGRFPIAGAMELPFITTNAKGGSKAIDEWYRRYAGKEMGDVKFCLMTVHEPGTFHSRTKKIVMPEDVKGLKVRPANATIGNFITQLGGSNVQASAPEARDVIEKGVADAITFPWGSMLLFGLDKVTKYHMNAPFYVSPIGYVMNKAKYDAMSPAQKKVIDDHCSNEWAVKMASAWADFEMAGLPKFQAMKGQEVYSLTPEQAAAWKAAAEPVRKTWADNVRKSGNDPDAILKDLSSTIEKAGAAPK
jgi:TRAP-type C4-dicarboxylate transport system substrate-binding protein